MTVPILSIIVPLTNKSGSFLHLTKRLNAFMDYFAHLIALVLVNNGSKYSFKCTTILGSVTVCLTMSYFIASVLTQWFFGAVVESFASLLFIKILFSSILLLAVSSIGKDVLRIVFQSKNVHYISLRKRLSTEITFD